MEPNLMLFRLIIVFLIPVITFAKSISDYRPYSYELIFTNPKCKKHSYSKPLLNLLGDEVSHKKVNAYCAPSDTWPVNQQLGTPHKKILDWIQDPETKEIFMAYLSFSKTSVIKALCKAVKERNLKLTLIVDEKNKKDKYRMRNILNLKKCIAKKTHYRKIHRPLILTGGHQGEGYDKIGYAHNKLIFINPNSRKKVRIVFSSGNMSSGTTTHHENWHFLTTNVKTHFVQAHLCLKEGLLHHQNSKRVFSKFIKQCRSKITTPEESDLKVFFIPGSGKRLTKQLYKEFKNSKRVKMAAHRFSNGSLIKMIKENLQRSHFEASIIVDDDLHWTGVFNKDFGRNTLYEFQKLMELEDHGLEIKYIETYADRVNEPKSLQLQHNKFIIFTKWNEAGTVLTGAGNLTNAAFYKNFENFYLISIPEVYKNFLRQYDYLWDLGLSHQELPIRLELPK